MNKIEFKKLTKNDMPLFKEWAKQPHVKNTWFQEGYETLDKYESKIAGNGVDYPFIIFFDNKPIGYIQASDLYAYRTLCPTLKGVFTHEDSGTFCFDLFIGEEDYLNKGYGTEIVKSFVDKLLTEFKTKRYLLILLVPISARSVAMKKQALKSCANNMMALQSAVLWNLWAIMETICNEQLCIGTWWQYFHRYLE